jgi:hypothetical protein
MKDWRIIIAGVISMIATLVTSVVAAIEGITLSSLAGTTYEPLLLLTGASTSLSFFLTKKWALPSFFITILASFSVHMFPTVHNVSATLFYVSAFILIFLDKHIRWYRFILLLPFIFAIHSLLAFEVAANLLLVLYHLYYIVRRVEAK